MRSKPRVETPLQSTARASTRVGHCYPQVSLASTRHNHLALVCRRSGGFDFNILNGFNSFETHWLPWHDPSPSRPS